MVDKSAFDILLDTRKIKFIQLRALSSLDRSDWAGFEIINLGAMSFGLLESGVPKLSDSEKREFCDLSRKLLGTECLSMAVWDDKELLNAGSGCQALFALWYLTRNKTKDDTVILFRYEWFHHLCYVPIFQWLFKLECNFVVLSTNNVHMIDDLEHFFGNDVGIYIELNNGSIVDKRHFISSTGKDPNRSMYLNVERLYLDYVEGKVRIYGA